LPQPTTNAVAAKPATANKRRFILREFDEFIGVLSGYRLGQKHAL
jgi:hypothetical protein